MFAVQDSVIGDPQASRTGFEVRAQLLDHVVGVGAGRKGPIESHGDEPSLDVRPRLLADHEIAAHVEQDVADAGLDAEIAKAPAVELALAVERGETMMPSGRRSRWRR